MFVLKFVCSVKSENNRAGGLLIVLMADLK